MIDVGNLVGEGEATVLTDVTRMDPIYVFFNLNEKDLLRVIDLWRRRVKELGLDPEKESGRKANLVIEVGLNEADGYPFKGKYDFGASGLDTTTGTIELRGVLDNKDVPPALIPGLFVRIRMPFFEQRELPLVTERAIGFDQAGPFLLIVNSTGQVEKRAVVLGRLVDGLRIIESGVTGEDRVVVKGIQRVRPGSTVEVQPGDMSAFRASVLAAKKTDSNTPPDEK
jgi:RND family efflux transporter MFP subunit